MGGSTVPWAFLLMHAELGWHASRRVVRGWAFPEPFPAPSPSRDGGCSWGSTAGSCLLSSLPEAELLLRADENLLWEARPGCSPTPLLLFLEARSPVLRTVNGRNYPLKFLDNYNIQVTPLLCWEKGLGRDFLGLLGGGSPCPQRLGACREDGAGLSSCLHAEHLLWGTGEACSLERPASPD